ncbi:putative RNA-directed DNA polymerase [Helianthus annuus]|nr:putative RNA-directed DNA polymerase [Helianthus annuus]
MGGNLVSCSAEKQPTVSRSSCESEYRAMANTATELVWITHLLRELHALPPHRPTLLCDNKSPLFMTQNPVSHKRAKHIDLDYHFIRELVNSGKLYTKFTGAGGSKSSGNAGSRNPDAGATPSTAAHEEEEEEEVTEKLISRKRTRSETTTGVASASVAGAIPLIGKTSNLHSLYKFSPETKKKTPEKGVTFTEPEPKRPKITIKSSKTVGAESAKDKNVAEVDKVKAAEEKRKVDEERRKKAEEEKKKKIEEDKKAEEAKRKKASDMEKEKERKKAVEKPIDDLEFVITTGPEKPHQERRKEPEFEKPIHPTRTEVPNRTKVTSTRGSGRYVSSGASSGGAGGYNPQVIGAKDTLGDIYYKSYTEEERGNAPHQAPWGLKQRDTFQEFGPCRDWFLNSFTPGEVNRQRAKTHEGLYRTYVIGEANTRTANHQIVREWRTMVRERSDWESYRERMLKRISEFEKSKAAFDEEKAKFDADKKAEEWGREGLKNKLQAAEQQLAKEKAEFKRICEKDNERAFAARNKIVNLEAKVVELTAKVEDAQAAQAAKEQIEVELADVKLQLSCKDKDLQAKDVEIAELNAA